jgi:hypothetical protein
MAIKPIPGYGKPPAGTGYKTFVGSTNALPKAKAVPYAYLPGMGPAADRPGYTPETTTTTITNPGSTAGKIKPSYNLELTSDFAYDPTMKAYNEALQGARDSLRDQIRQAVIRSGYDIRGKVPASLASYVSDIDDPTMATANANQLSDRAQLQKQLDTGLSDLAYNLAGRGTQRSGALSAGAGDLDQQYQVASNDQQNSLLDAIGGGVGGYEDISRSARSQRDAALQAIADRLSRLPGGTYDDPTDGGTTTTTTGGATSGGQTLGISDMPWLPGITDEEKARIAGPSGDRTGTSIDWGGQTFYTQSALAKFLNSRNGPGSFAKWQAQHPGALRMVQP